MHATHQQTVASLRKATIFNSLSTEALQRLTTGTTDTEFHRGQVIFHRGAMPTGIHVVALGKLKLCLDTADGIEHVVELLQEDDSFGEAALLTNRAHLVTATALTNCKLLHISRQTLHAELERDAELARRMVGTLSDRLYRQTSDLENVLFRKATGRVARFILDRLPAAGTWHNRRLTLPAKKGLIASQLNMTQEHFSRTLRELIGSGLISVDGDTVDVIEVDQLRHTAGMMPMQGYLSAAE